MKHICGTTVAEKKVKHGKEDKVRGVCYHCFILLQPVTLFFLLHFWLERIYTNGCWFFFFFF